MGIVGGIEHFVGALFSRGRSVLPRPFPDRPVGTDQLPQIRHIVIVMQENHSFDNYLGVLGRGDGFRLDGDGQPLDSNPTKAGQPVRAHHFPDTTQVPHIPTQSWEASHEQFGQGRNDGFVRSIEDAVVAGEPPGEPPGDPHLAMGFWDEADLPFYYGLARTFPLCDRWFGSCLGPTIPNRRFLISGTAHGLTTDALSELFDEPPAGTIFDALSRHGISWVNYHSSERIGLASVLRPSRLREELQSMTQFTADVYPLSIWRYVCHIRSVGRFQADCRAGRLPAVSIVDPDFDQDSEENPQDIRRGAAFAAGIINEVLTSPAWPHTLLIWTYDEHGGYYDHVPPPPAPAPDDVAPKGQPGHYDRLGFRVPAVVASPYARPGYVSHVVHDHTSVLKLIETKWNLPALTRRDLAADDLLDCLDLAAPPAFAQPPVLPPALPAPLPETA